MLSLPMPIVRQMLLFFRQRNHLPVKRQRPRLHPVRDLCFELLDVVDIMLDLEQRLHLRVPEEAVFDAIGDVVEYLAFPSAEASAAGGDRYQGRRRAR